MDAALGEYGFPDGHPFSTERLGAFQQGFQAAGLDAKVTCLPSAMASRAQLELFHTAQYIDKVILFSERGSGQFDADTCAFPGVYEKTARVVGTVLHALDDILSGQHTRAFVPIAGLHHARRHTSAGFCVFNDCGVAIEYLRAEHNISRIAYVDIDAHHGDGVFYSYETDPDLIFADLHEDGAYLYPGTGGATETGKGDAKGSKRNIPVPPEADDAVFFPLWAEAEAFIRDAKPDFILFQCGADSIAGDPLTHLKYSPNAHYQATKQLVSIADDCCQGRLLALGGGGYALNNLTAAWTKVVLALL